jgi:16S rRNA (cytosine1402-N4)-methyltransferase
MPDDHPHDPVLLDRCVELLLPALTRRDPDGAGATLVDATLGAGGHAERFLTQLPGLHLIGLDRDRTALQIAGERLAPFGDRVTYVHTRYDGFWADRVDGNDPGDLDGVLFDLGVSSMQLDRAERGFSYSQDAPLDMRMDQDAPLTAAEILNTYDKRALTRILQEFGEERFASRIAGEVVRRRERKPFETTAELVELLYDAIPAPARRTGGHPAKRTFQALRTAVNGELDSLASAVPAALAALREGGRIVVMAYQSLEDRIVKREFASATASRTPPGLPVELPGHEPYFLSLTRGAEKAGDAEIDLNPRSASVRLRALEKVAHARSGMTSVRRDGS